MKSAAFCEWMFDQLGAARGDELENPFVGSGAIERAWSMFQASSAGRWRQRFRRVSPARSDAYNFSRRSPSRNDYSKVIFTPDEMRSRRCDHAEDLDAGHVCDAKSRPGYWISRARQTPTTWPATAASSTRTRPTS